MRFPLILSVQHMYTTKNEKNLVTALFLGCTCSLTYDATASMQLNEKFFKLIAWFDNERGYLSRMADLLAFMHEKDNEECEKPSK